MPAGRIPGKIGQASEGLDSLPLIAETVSKAGVDAPGLDGLARLIAEEISPAEWVGRPAAGAERARKVAA